MNWPRLIFAIILLVVGGTMIAYNATIFWLIVVRKEPAPSVVPIFGGVIAAAGIAMLPITGSWHWTRVPLVIDWGGFRILLAYWLQQRKRA